MSLPNDDEIVRQVHSIIVKAYETDTVSDHSKRKIREMLNDHFGVNLESRKKFINDTTQEQVNIVAHERSKASAKASSSRSTSPKKPSAAASKAKLKAASISAPSTKKSAAKRKLPSFEDEDEDEDGDGDGAYVGSATVSSDISDVAPDESEEEEEEEPEFSELEEDTSTSRSRKKSKSSTSKTKASSSSTVSSKPAKSKKATASRSSTGGGSEAEQRLTRLKKLVGECGVRKQWKKLYEAAGVDETDFSGQCTVVQGVLKELGMTGKGSLEQARKIRDEREFADELAALQDNPVIDDDSSRRTRRSSGSGAKGKAATISISDDDGASDFEQEAPARKSSKKARPSKSDSTDSEDEGPTRRKNFKSSLASFAADLNSDSD